jgi:hypothetical protein
VAAGYSTSNGIQASTLVDTWNGATWTLDQSPNAGGSDEDHISGVSCAGAACVAVGDSSSQTSNDSTLVISGNLAVGYRFVASDGGIFSFNAPFSGSMACR